jgi:hypothetical protein
MLGLSRRGATRALQCLSACLSVLVSLYGCAAHEQIRVEQTGQGDAAVSTEAERDAGVAASDTGADANDAPVGSGAPDAAQVVHVLPTCGAPVLTESGELPVACPDAGHADAGLADAAARGSDATTPVAEAGAPSDATTALADANAVLPDAALFGPCAETARDCSRAYFEAQLPATCSLNRGFGGDMLTVRYQACEACNKPGTLNQYYVRVNDCDGCAQVYAEIAGSSYRTNGKGCTNLVASNVSLGNTQANGRCIDVYVGVGSATMENVTDGFHTIRACRCNRETGSCVGCTSTACDGT